MEKFRLISMVDFVLEQTELLYENNTSKLIHRIVNYAQFLKQPLQLGMFVPCDEMTEVMNYEEIKQSVIEGTDSWDAYEKAKEKVLFEGFEVKGNYIMYYDFMYMMKYELENKNIESIIEEIPNNNLTLTENAIKQIGL